MIPRDYQSRMVAELWDWFRANADGHPILVAPTGSGKSLLSAIIVQQATAFRAKRPVKIVVLAPSVELIAQNEAKLRAVWPAAPLGVVCSGMRRREFGQRITYGTIGSLARHADKLGQIDLVIVDECHSVKTSDSGQYRRFIGDLRSMNPKLRMVGLTATPFRGNGVYITDGSDPLFSGIASQVTIPELLAEGYLSPLVTPTMGYKIDTSGVRKSGADYNVADLEAASDRDAINQAVANDVIQHMRAHDRRAAIAFCVTVQHAEHIAEAFRARGVDALVVHGDLDAGERARRIAAYQAGRCTILVTVLALLTGFDAPHTDTIVWLRDTRSPLVWVQGLGRGMRPSPGKTDCLILDYTGTSDRLGPVDLIKGRPANPSGGGAAPTRTCPDCATHCPASSLICGTCGHKFPEPDRIKHGTHAAGVAVMSEDGRPRTDQIGGWHMQRHDKIGSPPCVRVSYLSPHGRVVATEFIHPERDGWLRSNAEKWHSRVRGAGELPSTSDEVVALWKSAGYQQPDRITTIPDPANPRYRKIAAYLY